MDRLRLRVTGRVLVGLVVFAAAVYGGAAAGGLLELRTAPHSDVSSRHAAVHEQTATLRALVPIRAVDRVTKSGFRETFGLGVAAIAVALAFSPRRRGRQHTAHLLPASVRFGAPRAPPTLRPQP
jgi:hypothetical protein